MTTYKKITAGFSIIIFLLAIMGAVFLFTTLRMAATYQKIYTHPFTVSNTAKDVRIHIVAIQRDMKNILLLRDRGQMKAITTRINKHEKEIAGDFVILFERFLGDPEDIQRLYETFIEWGMVRKEIMTLVEAGKMEKAIQIDTTQSAQYADSLSESTRQLIVFATEKMEELQLVGRQGERLSLLMIYRYTHFSDDSDLYHRKSPERSGGACPASESVRSECTGLFSGQGGVCAGHQ